MIIETGSFGRFGMPWQPYSTGVYFARIIIGRDLFKKLQIREYEKSDILTPCIGYLHDNFGAMGDNWWITDSYTNMYIYFSKYEDALQFLLRWS
jgi:hypothetical protein